MALAPILLFPTGVAGTQQQSTETVQFEPSSDGTELLPGGTYVIAIHAAGEFDSPEARVSIVSDGPVEIESIDGRGYDTTSADGRIAEASADESRPRGTSLFVSVRIPESVSVDSVTLSATIQDDTSVAEGRQTYSIVGSDRVSSTETLAEQARARAQVATAYADMYTQLTTNAEEFQLTIRDALIEGITTIGIEATKGYAIGQSRALAAADQAWTLAGVARDGDLPSGLIGEVAPIFDTMIVNYSTEMKHDAEVRQNDVGTSYRQLARLYEAEATAWENGTRERARRVIRDERRVLCRQRGDYLDTLGEPAHKLCGEHVAPPNTFERNSTERAYYRMVRDYQRTQPAYIAGYLRNYSTAPNPSVRTERSTEDLSQRLGNLGVGESMTLSITAANGGDAGFVERGYVSVSYSNNLRVTAADVTEVNPADSDDDLRTSKTRPGTDISGPGRDTAKYPLVDVFEAYKPGESNTYEITITRTEAGNAWVNYRAAFLPVVHSQELQNEFIRAPSGGETDQQGYSVVEIIADSQSTTPRGGDATENTPVTEAEPESTAVTENEPADPTPTPNGRTPVADSPTPEGESGNAEPTPDGSAPGEQPGGENGTDGTPATVSDGELLENPTFDESLDGWMVTYSDPPNQERGSASWTGQAGGAAQLSVSGAPSNIIIYQPVKQRIPAGTTFAVDVRTGGALDCCGGVTLRLDGEGVATLRHPADGRHRLTYTTEQSYAAGTRLGIRTAIWPGNGEARITAVSWQRNERHEADESETGPVPDGTTPTREDDGETTVADEDRDSERTGDSLDEPTATTEPTATQRADDSGDGIMQAVADLLREIADAIGSAGA